MPYVDDHSKISCTVLLVFFLTASCTETETPTAGTEEPEAYVGSERCADCHRQQFEAWQGSHHELAMQTASQSTVLGEFADTTFDYFGETTTFYRKDGAYFVRTPDSSGESREFEISHTFGVFPLQQYLVAFADGRRQSLPFTWDARDKGDGGQRWYHMFPDDHVEPGDPLHWTGPYFNWNTMCAECHSTNLSVGYDIESNSFDTTFDEISVGCEACHGPGGRHVIQAQTGRLYEATGLDVDLDDRDAAAWVMNPTTGIAERSKAADRLRQPEACGRCHARRGVIAADYEFDRPLADTHLPSLLDEGLYHADGRILEEVYVYGSFLQSRMYRAGVTCTDCHDPHSATLRAGPDPDDTCAQCHLPSRFANNEHRGGTGSPCVDCHMRSEVYMGVDARRDHSFRLPEAMSDPEHYGHAIAAGRQGGANEKLAAAIADDDYPPIVRGTLLSLMRPTNGARDLAAIESGLADEDPLVRIGALRALQNSPAQLATLTGTAMLRDPVRAVRVEAARVFLDQRDLLPVHDARAFGAALEEYRESLMLSASMPRSSLGLAELESALGRTETARFYYEHTLALDSRFAPAHHAYGLFLVRSGDPETALTHIRRAANLEPANSRFVYVYGIALNSLGRIDQALDVMSAAWTRFADDPEIGFALATMQRDAGDRDAAIQTVNRLLLVDPANESAIRLRDSLKPTG